MQKLQIFFRGVAALLIGANVLYAAVEPLSGDGAKLEARYAARMQELQGKIQAALPSIDAGALAAYLAAREAESVALLALQEAQTAFGQIAHAQSLVGHAKNKWIADAKKGIAKAQELLEKAQTDADRSVAQAALAEWQSNLKEGEEALLERQALLDKAKADEPALSKQLDAAKAGYATAQDTTAAALRGLGLEDFLSSSALDAQLAEYMVLHEGTPRGLAAFAEQSDMHAARIDALLGKPDLMLQMVVADGATEGRYGQAMAIYTDILGASAKAQEGVLQRLALAIALEHAAPVKQRNAEGAADAPAVVDPLQRYLNYEKAFLEGELDPYFKDLTVWDLRMVVDGEEPDAIAAWGREMLRTYRPDHITTDDTKWRYVASVRTEVRYGSQYNKYDKPELHFFQNILMNGGICGRRAFFGRFILRAFGVPTTARPQRGHAALAHWTPKGWVINLGAGWGSGWTKTRYKDDLDFLATTQARALGDAYLQIKRAQWVGAVMGEKPAYGMKDEDPAFWYGVSLYRQRFMIAGMEALAAAGEELGEANESDVDYAFVSPSVSEEERLISVDKDGVITIPAAATSKPTESTGKILFMESNLGGMQLHYSRTGNPETFEYVLDVPSAGMYALTARVASPSWGQLLVVAPSAGEPVEMAVPLTVGLWGKTEPVEVNLAKGRNVLTFSRTGDNIRGVTIKDFRLAPMK